MGPPKDKGFVWERPLSQNDVKQLAALGREVPEGEFIGARVEHELAKQVLIDEDPRVFFTIPHFDNYPAILVKLATINENELYEVIVEAWLNRAPTRLAQQFLQARPD